MNLLENHRPPLKTRLSRPRRYPLVPYLLVVLALYCLSVAPK